MKKLLTTIMGCLFLQFGFAQYAEYDWNERDTWMDVNYILEKAGIEAGSRVADIGCHEGYFTVHLANKVGDEGKVYAVDVKARVLNKLRGHLDDRKLTNVEVILGDYDNPKLPENSLDVVVIMDTYHEMTDYMTILSHVKTALKPDGKIVIIEKLKSWIKGKSRKAQTDAHSLSMKYVKEELKETGFSIIHQDKDIGEWENNPDKVIWIVVGEKPTY